MTPKARIRYLFRAARRAAREGDGKIARTLHRMAREAVLDWAMDSSDAQPEDVPVPRTCRAE